VAPNAILNAFMYVDDWDATGDSNQMDFTGTQPALDGTTFRSGGWEVVGGSGLKKLNFGFNGFWSAATTAAQDPQSFNQLGAANRVFTAGIAETEGAPAFIWKGGQFDYQAFGEINTLAPFSIQSTGTDGIGAVRGKLTKAKGDVTGTGGMGTVVDLGAVSAGKYLYCAVHVFTAGTTISMDLASDDDVGFASGTTRASIGPLTTAGGTYVTRVAGPITDNYFLLNVTAITGTFNIAAAIAVQ
jgi:hypothetical protein